MSIIFSLHTVRIIDIPHKERVTKTPDGTFTILESGNYSLHGFEVRRVTLKQYIEKNDEKLGLYSLITSEVQTDKGTIEMIYDEGFRGDDALARASKFLAENLGISGLVLRSIIALESHIANQNGHTS